MEKSKYFDFVKKFIDETTKVNVGFKHLKSDIEFEAYEKENNIHQFPWAGIPHGIFENALSKSLGGDRSRLDDEHKSIVCSIYAVANTLIVLMSDDIVTNVETRMDITEFQDKLFVNFKKRLTPEIITNVILIEQSLILDTAIVDVIRFMIDASLPKSDGGVTRNSLMDNINNLLDPGRVPFPDSHPEDPRNRNVHPCYQPGFPPPFPSPFSQSGFPSSFSHEYLPQFQPNMGLESYQSFRAFESINRQLLMITNNINVINMRIERLENKSE